MLCARGIASRAPITRSRGSSTNSGFSLIEVLFGCLLTAAIAVLSLPTIEDLAFQAEAPQRTRDSIPVRDAIPTDDLINSQAGPTEMSVEAGIDANAGGIRDKRAGNGQAQPLQGGTGQ